MCTKNRLLKSALCAFLSFIMISLAGLSGSRDDNLQTPLPIEYEEYRRPETAPEGLGVTLEFLRYDESGLKLLITNASGRDIRYGNGHEITGTQWGYSGSWDDDSFPLPSGEQCVISIPSTRLSLQFGEYRITKNIIIDPMNPVGSRIYQLHAEFALENTTIPADIHSVMMEIRPGNQAQIGAIVTITNGFDNGRLYYDNSYRIQQMVNGVWQDMPLIASDNFPDDKLSLAPRQVLPMDICWAWLYGYLPPGEYRFAKSFLHRADDGKETRYDLYATFSLDGSPLPETVEIDGVSVQNPFYGYSVLRAKVLEHIDPDSRYTLFGTEGILVAEMVNPVLVSATSRYIVWDSYPLVVLNADKAQISFADIPVGATVEIYSSGLVFTTDPGQIALPFFIRIVA